MRRLLVLAAIALAACGGDNGPSRIEIEGNWSGNFTTSGGTLLTLTMTLTETAGTVTGTGTTVSSGGSIAETIEGTYSPPQVSLTLHSQGFTDSNLTGTVGETTITGVINGSGFTSVAVTLTRQ